MTDDADAPSRAIGSAVTPIACQPPIGVTTIAHLETVIDQLAAYGQMTSSIMQSAPVSRRGISLEALEG